MHVLSLADGREVMVGRGDDCHLRVKHSGVSRLHAAIRFVAGSQSGFFLEDKQSKFGTCVALPKHKALDANDSITVNVGNTVITLTLQPMLDPSLWGMIPMAITSPLVVAGSQLGTLTDEMQQAHRQRSDSASSFGQSPTMCAGDGVIVAEPAVHAPNSN